MPRQHVLTMLALAALAGSCGDPTEGSDMWAPLGYTAAPGGGGGAADTICTKLAECGLFKQGDDIREGAATTAYVVASQQQAQASNPFYDACVAEAEEMMEDVESKGVSVPWDGLAACFAGVSCAQLKSTKDMLDVLGQCATQLGISIGTTTVKQPDPQPPVYRDAGVTIPDYGPVIQRDSGVEPFPDMGEEEDAW